MTPSKSKFFLAFVFIMLLGLGQVKAQKTTIDKQLEKKYKSLKGYEELQAQLKEQSPLADIEISFELHKRKADGLANVSDSVDEVFLVIEQYRCYTYGANPKLSHYNNELGSYSFKADIWDPNCIAIDFGSKELNYYNAAEWNPDPFSSKDSIVTRQKTIDLYDNYVLKIEYTWTRNKPLQKSMVENRTGTVIGTLTHFVPHPTKENHQTSKQLPNTEIAIPDLDITVDSDRYGNFVLRDVPAKKPFTLISKSPSSNAPDTLTFVAAPDKIIDLEKVMLNLDN